MAKASQFFVNRNIFGSLLSKNNKIIASIHLAKVKLCHIYTRFWHLSVYKLHKLLTQANHNIEYKIRKIIIKFHITIVKLKAKPPNVLSLH